MIKYFSLFLICFIGCRPMEQLPPAEPEISVTRTENSNNASIALTFKNHNLIKENGYYYVGINLDNIDQIIKYKKQVEFALSQINETESNSCYKGIAPCEFSLKAEITIEFSNNSFNIKYKNHFLPTGPSGGTYTRQAVVSLNNLSDIVAYKKQLQLLNDMLDQKINPKKEK